MIIDGVDQNIIAEVSIKLDPITGKYAVSVTKAFAAQYGGGEQTFQLGTFRNIHRALDAGREAVTVSPTRRTE